MTKTDVLKQLEADVKTARRNAWEAFDGHQAKLERLLRDHVKKTDARRRALRTKLEAYARKIGLTWNKNYDSWSRIFPQSESGVSNYLHAMDQPMNTPVTKGLTAVMELAGDQARAVEGRITAAYAAILRRIRLEGVYDGVVDDLDALLKM